MGRVYMSSMKSMRAQMNRFC